VSVDQQAAIAAGAAVVSLIALLAAAVSNNRLTTIRRNMAMLQGRNDAGTLLDIVADYVARVNSLDGRLKAQAKRQEELFALLGRSARNLGVVRYDAFDDMGGRMSFSIALLDDHGNGVVITSINARAESRAYAKAIRGGASEHNLSAEEQRAITDALGTGQKVKR
jgi:hypothetical protein